MRVASWPFGLSGRLRRHLRWLCLLSSGFVSLACEPAQSPAASSGGRDAGTAAVQATADAGPVERPFAGSTAEATAMISEIVDRKQHEIFVCVHDFRTRKNLPKERVAISFGIDQEGKLLGVTSKGKEDAELQSCIQGALRTAAFPRSHSGVITVTKTYEELVL